MKHRIASATLLLTIVCLLTACRNKLEEKGFAVTPTKDQDDKIDGLSQGVLFPTRPSSVLLTGHSQFRLTTIYKVNFAKDSTTFIGSDDYHFSYGGYGDSEGNQWNSNYLPGFEAVYGYNLVNVSHYNTETQKQKTFFEKPVLIRTLYFPSFSKDTLNYKPVNREYFMVSAYDEDTDNDGFINVRDLRRLYHFDINGDNKRYLIPANYSVDKSEYDPANDYINIFARLDENKNGQIDELESVHIFWIDLKNPDRSGRLY